MTIKFIVSFAAMIPLAVLAQTPAPSNSQPGSIRGIVIGSDTNAGLNRAAILLRPMYPDGSAGAVIRGNTDEKGEFVLPGIAPGRYMLTAERSGYGRVNYTEGAAGFRVATFTVKSGEVKSIRLRLMPLGVVTGSIAGPDGGPLPHAKAILSHYMIVDGVRTLLPEREVRADQKGAFLVTAVPAGQYLLSAYSRDEVVYAPSYYPGVPSASSAQPIKVEVGRIVQGLKLQLATAASFVISGHVTDATGKAVQGAVVLARRQPEDGIANLLSSESLTAQSGSGGEFALPRLLPGKYRLELTPGAQKLTGSTMVDLGTQDVKGVTITAVPGAIVTGRIVFEGNLPGVKRPLSPHTARISLRADVQAGGPAIEYIPGTIADDSTFRIENVPEGPMRFDVGMSTDRYYLKAIRQNGSDLTDQTLNVRQGDQIESVEVVIAVPAAQLTGRVAPDIAAQSGTQQPEVILFPRRMETPRARQRLTKVAHVNESGQFTIRGIAPGEYSVIAVRNAQEGSEADPNFQAALRLQAKHVTLATGLAAAGTLQVTDAPQ
jgi:hypothetical protein